jgi:hypothetical protein
MSGNVEPAGAAPGVAAGADDASGSAAEVTVIWTVAVVAILRLRLFIARLTPSRPALPVFWDDLPTTALRRLLPVLLLTLRFDLDFPRLFEPLSPAPAVVLTRAQRAHRRLPYPQRLARNALPSTARSGSIHIHGLPLPVSRHLAALGHGARDP